MSQMTTEDWIGVYLIIIVFGAVAIALASAVDLRNRELKKWLKFTEGFLLGVNHMNQQIVDQELTKWALVVRRSSLILIALQRQDPEAIRIELAANPQESLEEIIAAREAHFHMVQEKFYGLYDSAAALITELHLELDKRSWKTYAKDKDKRRTA